MEQTLFGDRQFRRHDVIIYMFTLDNIRYEGDTDLVFVVNC